jgi:hypothetical protein
LSHAAPAFPLSPSALILTIISVRGSLIIADRAFPARIIVSVPSYTIHRDPTVGDVDVEA